MNCKNVIIGIAVLISPLHLLAVAVSAQDDVFESGARSSHPPREKSVLAASSESANNATNNQRCFCIDEADLAASEKIEHALHSPLPATGLEFTDTPLTEVIGNLQDRYAIPIHLDRTAMDDLGVNVDEPVTVSLRGISLQAALRLILRPLGLTYTIENEVLLITTRDAEAEKLITCVYDVHDLAAAATPSPPSKGASSYADFDRLTDVVTSCIAKDTWSENGGTAEIRPFGSDLLVVSQTRDVHVKIRNLLSTIRKLKPDVSSPQTSDSPSSGSYK